MTAGLVGQVETTERPPWPRIKVAEVMANETVKMTNYQDGKHQARGNGLHSNALNDIIGLSGAKGVNSLVDYCKVKHNKAATSSANIATLLSSDAKLKPCLSTRSIDSTNSKRELIEGVKTCRVPLGRSGRDPNDLQDEDVDGGYAWVILVCMFLINASTYGTARAYGLIFDKIAREDGHTRSDAALPFTIMGALENMCGPLGGYLLSETKSWRAIVFLGSLLYTLAHLLAAYFDTLTGQVVTMGIMAGAGLSFVTISSFQINNAYFVRYRSRAFGLGLTGAVMGTFYISPICQYVLDNSSINYCYLILSLILFPNILLSLMLKPKTESETKCGETKSADAKQQPLQTISGQVDRGRRLTVWQGLSGVISEPMFHLIWPLQLLFCWLNFVYGMIIVDFGKDRGLDAEQAARLIPIWAFGQLAGRIGLGSLVDMKLVSNRSFTVISFALISLATLALNKLGEEDYEQVLLFGLIFVLSMFIATLYILFNNLVVIYMDKQLTALSIGVSSFVGSFFLLPRANVIGYYRDTVGSYDSMLYMSVYINMAAALVWLLVPELFAWLRSRRT